jgi:hypothetical protein
MDAIQVLIVLLFAVLLGMNIVATVKVHASEFYEPHQKVMQYALIWMIPLVGAILCYGLARQDDGLHSGKYADNNSLFDGGSFGIENANNDYISGGHHGDSNHF